MEAFGREVGRGSGSTGAEGGEIRRGEGKCGFRGDRW